MEYHFAVFKTGNTNGNFQVVEMQKPLMVVEFHYFKRFNIMKSWIEKKVSKQVIET